MFVGVRVSCKTPDSDSSRGNFFVMNNEVFEGESRGVTCVTKGLSDESPLKTPSPKEARHSSRAI